MKAYSFKAHLSDVFILLFVQYVDVLMGLYLLLQVLVELFLCIHVSPQHVNCRYQLLVHFL